MHACFRSFVVGLGLALAGVSAAADPLGMTVGGDGTILVEGRPFPGIGMNYVPGELFAGGGSVPLPEVVFPEATSRAITSSTRRTSPP